MQGLSKPKTYNDKGRDGMVRTTLKANIGSKLKLNHFYTTQHKYLNHYKSKHKEVYLL